MNHRNTIWKGLLACAVLMAMVTTAFAVTEADVVRLKNKLTSGETLTKAESLLALEAEEAFGSKILGDSPFESPRQPRQPLDDYVFETVAYEWIDITGNGTPAGITGDDQNVGPFNLGFTFSFYEQSYTSVRMCSNGWASFTSTTQEYFNGSIPSTATPNGALYPFWDDLYPPSGGTFFYYADAANQRFIMSWINVPHIGSTTELYSFQIVLYANGNIRYNYQTVFVGGTYGNTTCTVGIENAAGTDALQVCYDGNGTLPTSQTSFLFSQPDGVPNPPTNVTATPSGNSVVFTWVDPTHDTNGNPLTPSGIQIWMGPVGTGTLLATVAPGVQTYTATNLQAGNYTFNLRAAAGQYFSGAVTVNAVVGNPSYFADFEADDGDLISSGGWEWGAPSGVGPAGAYSGQNCWGTVLAGNYGASACYYLDIDQELTVASDAATLEFRMWLNAESNWDGINIKVSTDGGQNWVIVQEVAPVYSQATTVGNANCHAQEPGWSGNQSAAGWREMVVQLGQFAGTTPIIRFSFGSDASVHYPGAYIDDVILWGFGEPEFATVSGTVSLDGGAGTITSVTVSANGIGNPTTNPAANGSYTLTNVLTGNRRISGALAGYNTARQDIVLTAGGATNVNLTLVRLNPPVPTNLVGSANNQTGVVTLDWDNSTDPLVDDYPVYRRLQGDQDWVLQGTPTTSFFEQTLPGPGIYQFAVAARDIHVSTPVVSDLSPSINVLYGNLPVTSIGWSGNYDDRIRLNWLEPGIAEGQEIFYDDGTSETWFRVATPNGPNDYFCVRMTPPADATYPLMLYAANIYMERSDPIPLVALCRPNASNTGADLNNPLFSWTNIGADATPGWLFAETDGSVFLSAPGDFYIVIQFPPGGTGPGCGSDNSAPDLRSYWSNTYPTWNLWTSNDWMMRAWVGGPPPQGLAGNDGRIELVQIDGRGGYAEDRIPSRMTATLPPLDESRATKAEYVARAAYDTQSGFENPLDQWFAPYSRAPQVMLRVDRRGGNALDELLSYNIYRNAAQIGNVLAPTTTYMDIGVVENTPYQYYVTAVYDNGESGPSPTVTAMCNMPPAAPTSLTAEPQGSTQMVLSWVAPTTNGDATPLVDLAGYNVYRSGVLAGSTAAGVTTFTDTPPNPQFFYTWTVRAIDEVPNESAPSNGATAAVLSPWEIVDYEWIDIVGVGTVIVNGDDINSGMMPLPWNFEFYGTNYMQFSVCSNGFISFTSTSTSLGNGAIPSTAEPNGAIYPFWDDLNPGAGGDVYMYNDVNNERMIIAWVDVPHYGNNNLYTFQVILEPPTSITLQYMSMSDISSGTVGVENAAGTEAIMLFNNGTSPFGWSPTNQSAVAFWAPEPTYGPISGTVTLDGGTGNVTQVLVRASGRGTPTTNPNAQGQYTLAQVATGNRTVTGSLTGYNTTTVAVPNHTEGGTTGVNITLRRANPPVPTGLVGSVNSATGVVNLDWDNSTDPLVDDYPVYRRLQGEQDWVLQGTPTQSQFTQTLTASGIYQYAVAARDNNASTPVISDLTNPVTLLYGELPPTGLAANGNYDDRIVLSWFAPGTPPEFELSYDDGTNEVQGIAWWGGSPTFGWMAAKFQATAGNVTITRIKPFWSADAQVPQNVPVEVAVFADNAGVPTFTPLGVTNFLKNGVGAFQDVELTTPVTIPSPVFWVGVRQIGANALGLGGDNDTPFINNTFKYSFDGTAWTAFEPGLLTIPMLRCYAIGQFGGLMELSPAPINVSAEDLAVRTEVVKSNQNVTVTTVVDEMSMTTSCEVTPLAELQARGARAVMPHFPTIAPRISDERGGRTPRSLDDVTNYRVYRGGTQIAQVPATVLTYTDLNRIENTPYQYYVTALYDNGQESGPTLTVTAMCNMAPNAPSGLVANPLGTTQMALAWVAPNTNADGTPLVDLAGFRIYRDGNQVGTTAPGVTTYIDSPPDNQTFYTWTIRAIDEVPNVSNPSNSAIGAIVSPWEVADYEWIDITGNGTPAGITGDDQSVGPFPLGFNFEYFGQTYSSIRMCSNGFASFTSTATTWTNATIPTAAEPNTVLCPFWDDLYPPTGGGQYLYYSDAANGRFIMSWINVPHISSSTARYTFQIVLEAGGGIYFNYQLVASDAPGVTSMTIGVENQAGTDGILLNFNGAGPFTPANLTSVSFWAGPSGEINGIVREFGSNAPIANCEVWIEEISEFTLTDAQGNFVISVDPGTYTVRAHKLGYCDQVAQNVVVEDGGATTRTFSMRQPNATFSVSSLNIFATFGQNGVSGLEITNPTQGAMTCDVTYSITSDENWLVATPAQGTIAVNGTQFITVTANVAAFPVGEYTANLTIDHNDTGSPYEVPVTVVVSLTANETSVLPTEFALNANYPNPFNPSTSLNFDVPNEAHVQLIVYNVRGQEVARPLDATVQAGRHTVTFNADNLPTGMYLVKMSAPNFDAVQKIVLLK